MSSNITTVLKSELEESKDSCFSEGTSITSDPADITIDEENSIITNQMIEEEKKMAKKAAEDEERLRKEYEERLQEEEQEKKSKRLYHLLNRSQFYTNFLVKKIDSSIQEEKKKAELKKKQEERRKAELESRSLKEKNGTKTKSKSSVKRNRGEKEKITDYIDKEMIENYRLQPHLEDVNDDIFKQKLEVKETGTRVTSMGFVAPESQPLLFEGGVLRDYQLQGLEWMKVLWENGVNGILADEMGLGKTIQVIALICHMIENNVLGPFLIIAPLSTLPNWVMEFEKLAPQVPVVLFHGSKYDRPKLYHKLSKRVEVIGRMCAPVVITSYQVPRMEFKIMSSLKWRYIIVDEGHILKNIKSQLGMCLRSMKSVNRLLLTGTPLQNNLTELWALLNFLLPDIFDDLNIFETLFHLEDLENNSSNIIDQEEKHNVLSTLHQILTPFLLRRLKVDVEINIPPKKEVLVYCPMTPIQLELYRTTVDRSIVNLIRPNKNSFDSILLNPDGSKPKRKCAMKRRRYIEEGSDEEFEESISIKNEEAVIADKNDSSYVVKLVMVSPQMQLRKIVNHPYLVHAPINIDKTLRVDEELVNKSGKMLVIDAMLTKLKERGHKVLIFSFFKILLDLLEEVLYMRGYKFVRLDGSLRFEERKEVIREFNTDPDVFVFLITTRAGGLGLNLTSADTVIIFDSDWNPQADLQAMDRCHRIGQTKPTVVYRLITKGSVDEKIINVAGRKRKLEKMVIKKGKFKLNLKDKQELTNLEELKELLESTDHQKVIHSNGFVFSDQELDELLDRSDMIPNSDKRNVEQSENKLFKVVKQEQVQS